MKSQTIVNRFIRYVTIDPYHPKTYLNTGVFVMRAVGMLPTVYEHNNPYSPFYLFTLFAFVMVFTQLISQGFDLYFNWGDMGIITKNITVSTLAFGTSFRLITITIRQPEYRKIVHTVTNKFVTHSWSTSAENPSMSYWVDQITKKVIVYYIFGLFVAVYWCGHPLLPTNLFGLNSGKNSSADGNISYDESEWDFPSSAWYPFDAKQDVVYSATFVHQTIAICFSGMGIMGTDVLFVSLMLLTCGQFEIVSDLLRNAPKIAAQRAEMRMKGLAVESVRQNYSKTLEISSSEKENTVEDGKNNNVLYLGDYKTHKVLIEYELNNIIGWCVEHHNTLLKLIAEVENVYWPTMLVNFAMQLIILSFLGFEATEVTSTESRNPMKVTNTVSYLFLAILQLYLLCSCGDRLVQAELGVAYSTYESDWFGCSEGFKRSLRIVCLRAHMLTKLTVGKISEINMVTFSETLSKAFSYFTVLRQIRSS